MKLWNINDRGHTQSGPYMTPILKENATELGYGDMDLDTLSAIAIKNGVEGVILETHKNWVDNVRFFLFKDQNIAHRRC